MEILYFFISFDLFIGDEFAFLDFALEGLLVDELDDQVHLLAVLEGKFFKFVYEEVQGRLQIHSQFVFGLVVVVVFKPDFEVESNDLTVRELLLLVGAGLYRGEWAHLVIVDQILYGFE